ncbi:MAG: hypothetical protein U0M10_01440 [Oscillospiraceae bacterium]|nr:hypothetical protein [Oscillospiraceae bacterium]
MALIKCPGCGRDISDRALSCPQCGYQMQEHLTENTQGENVEIQEEGGVEADVLDAAFAQDKCEIGAQMQSTSKYKNRKHILIAAIAGIVLVSVIGAALGFGLLLSNSEVKDISIGKWCVEDFQGFDALRCYEITLKSKQKKPFVAVMEWTIGTTDSSMTQFVCMTKGKGKMMEIDSLDLDPTTNCRPIGYIDGVVVKKFDVDIECTEEYSDYSESEATVCTVVINFNMANKKTGLLVFDINNLSINDRVGSAGNSNIAVAVIDGKATYEYSAVVPYGSRSNNFKVKPRMFCESREVTGKDFTIESAYKTKKTSSDSDVYFGTETLAFGEWEDGVLLYTSRLLKGGELERRNVTEQEYTFIEDGECKIFTADITYDIDEDEALEPQYEFNYVGYIAWTPLKEETK